MWVQLVVSLVMMALAYALAPRPPRPSPAGLGDVQAPTAEVGRPIPVIFGTVMLRGSNVLWYGDLSTTDIKSSA
jgi:hypothetical protein